MTAAGIDELGLTASEVRPESTGRNLAIGIGGVLLVIAAGIPVVWAILVGVTAVVPVVARMLGGPAE
ncbi:hypothetical protein ACFVAJ_05575 [Agromyces sp. NPDC057679]|uniref:hypothetical protein n=1 Tax=Agromyces sp. NPDC057679 TaxID=3346207 RepID=UPI00366E2F5E